MKKVFFVSIVLLVLIRMICFAQSTCAKVEALQGEWILTRVYEKEIDEVIDFTETPFNEVEVILKFDKNTFFVVGIGIAGQSFIETGNFTVVDYSFLFLGQNQNESIQFILQDNTLTILFCSVEITFSKQEVIPSSLEGVWVSLPSGPRFYSELVFFNNVMLYKFPLREEFFGDFIYLTDYYIKMPRSRIDWKYRISGSILIITEEGVDFFLLRKESPFNPIEGIWRVIGGMKFDPSFYEYFLFVADILAIWDNYDPSSGFYRTFLGERIIFRDNYIYNARDNSRIFAFRMQENLLLLYCNYLEVILSKVY